MTMMMAPTSPTTMTMLVATMTTADEG